MHRHLVARVTCPQQPDGGHQIKAHRRGDGGVVDQQIKAGGQRNAQPYAQRDAKQDQISTQNGKSAEHYGRVFLISHHEPHQTLDRPEPWACTGFA